jgi:hypothetical protein
MKEELYRLDRTKVTAQTFNEAADHVAYWSDKSEDERLNAACFIINQIFGVTPETKVNRNVSDTRKQP